MPQVDPVILRLEAKLDKYKSDLTGATRLTDEKLSAIEARGVKMGQSLKTGFSLAASAAAGFVAANALGVITDQITKGLEYASSLGEVAQQLGVTTDALQEYRYAGSQAGLEQAEIDQSLQQLTRRLGEAASGAKAQAEAFEKLGISVKDANGNVLDAGEAIPLIAEALTSIQSPAERAAILMDLFGKSGQKLEPLLAGGAAGVNNLRDAAHELGIVLSSDQIQKADDAADKLSAVKQVLEARIAGVVADNAGAILDLANKLANLAEKALKAFEAIQKLADSPIGRVIGKLNELAGYTNPLNLIGAQIGGLAGDAPSGGGGAPRSGPPRGSGGSLLLRPKASGAFKPGGGPLKTNFAGDGFAFSDAGIASQAPGLGFGDVTARVDAAASLTAALEGLAEAARKRLDQEEAQSRLASDALESEADVATNREDRLRIERQILAIEQDIARKRLEEAIASGTIADAVKARADLATAQANQTKTAEQRFASPLDQYARDLGSTSVNDRIEGLVIDELQSVRDSIRSAVEKATGIKDPLISGLVNLLIEQVLIRPIAEALSKQGGGGGIGDIFSSVIGSLFGRASGGAVNAGQMYRVNEGSSPGRVEGFIPRGSGTIIPLGQMNAMVGSGGASARMFNITVDARNSVTPADFAQQLSAVILQQAAQMDAQASARTLKAVPGRVDQYQRDGN
jgi:hypothetical protein